MKNIVVTGQELRVLLTRENCFWLGEGAPGAGAAGLETRSLCSLPLASDDVAQATGPTALCAGERCVVPQHLAIPQEVPRHPHESEGQGAGLSI